MRLFPSETSELGIIAGLLSGNAELWTIADRYKVSSKSFTGKPHRLIFEELARRHEDGDPFDYLAICSSLPAECQQALTEALTNQPINQVSHIFEEHASTLYRLNAQRENRGIVGRMKEAAERGEDTSELAAKLLPLTPAEAKKKSRLSLRKFKEILNMEFDDSDCHFGDRVIASGQPVTILGPGGVGKSRMVMQLAMCMVVGAPFLGMPTHGQDLRWLFIQSENSNRRLKKDISAMVFGLGLVEEIKRVNRCLFFHTIETDCDTFLDLEDKRDEGEISALIEDVNPHFVVFDPLNTFTSLDLNTDQGMKAVCQSLSRVVRRGNPDRVPVVVHHSLTGKNGAARAVGWDKASYGRNSKVLQAWTRAQINITPADPEDRSKLVVSCGKNNNGADFPEIGAVLDGKGIYRVDPDFDPEAFREKIGADSSRSQAMRAEDVPGLFTGTVTKQELVNKVMKECGCSKPTAYRVVDSAAAKKLIIKSKGAGASIYRRHDEH